MNKLENLKPGIRHFVSERIGKDIRGRNITKSWKEFQLPDGSRMKINEWYAKVKEIVESDQELSDLYKKVKDHCKTNCLWLKTEMDLEFHAIECLALESYKFWNMEE